MSLPISEPFPPMEALLVDEIPEGAGWQYEPKWDGFRCLVFRDGQSVRLQSKSGQPLTRYFPELAELFGQFKAAHFVLSWLQTRFIQSSSIEWHRRIPVSEASNLLQRYGTRARNVN